MLVLLLGSNIGNFDVPAAHEFLRAIRGALDARRRAAARRRSREAGARSAARLRRSARRHGGVQPQPARPHQPRARRHVRSRRLRARRASGTPRTIASRCTSRASPISAWSIGGRAGRFRARRAHLDRELVQVRAGDDRRDGDGGGIRDHRTVDRRGSALRADAAHRGWSRQLAVSSQPTANWKLETTRIRYPARTDRSSPSGQHLLEFQRPPVQRVRVVEHFGALAAVGHRHDERKSIAFDLLPDFTAQVLALSLVEPNHALSIGKKRPVEVAQFHRLSRPCAPVRDRCPVPAHNATLSSRPFPGEWCKPRQSHFRLSLESGARNLAASADVLRGHRRGSASHRQRAGHRRARRDRNQAGRRVHRGGLGARAGGQRLPAARAEGRRRRRRSRPRSRSPTTRANIYVAVFAHDPEPAASSACAPGATRSRRPTGCASSSTRSTTAAPRSSSPSIRPASSATSPGRTTPARTRAGTRCGTSSVSQATGRLARRVPDPVLAAALPALGQRDVRVRGRPPDRPPQRDGHLAAPLEGRERHRLLVRRSDRPAAQSDAEAARARALRRRRR